MPTPPSPNKPANQVVCTDEGIDRSASRRAFERVPCLTTAMAFEITPDDTVLPGCPANVQNLSKSGIGLRSRRMYNVGTQVVILISTKGSQTRPYFGIIRQCRYAGKALYAVGVEFTPPIETESVTRWMIQNCPCS